MGDSFITLMYAVSILFVFGLLIVWGIVSRRHDREEFIPSKVKDLKYDKKTKTLTFKGARTGNECTAIGSNTVWYTVDGERFGTDLEAKLANIYHYWKRQNPEDE